MKVKIAKRKVLLDISNQYRNLGDWKYFSVLVYRTKNSKLPTMIESYNQLVEVLKDYDTVYDFSKVDTGRHGEIGYDIILKEY